MKTVGLRGMARRSDWQQVSLRNRQADSTAADGVVVSIVGVWNDDVVGIISAEEEDANQRLVIGRVVGLRECVHQEHSLHPAHHCSAGQGAARGVSYEFSASLSHGITSEPGRRKTSQSDRWRIGPARSDPRSWRPYR